jgi:RNA polymerase sigma-70 factor (ECF subfamily)
VDVDEASFDKLKAYLECRSRKVDPPAPLVAAWEQFYGTYRPRIRALLGRTGLQEADREDCLQDVWQRVVAHLGHLPYDPRRGHLWAWLRTVARNRVVDTIRRRRHLWVGLNGDKLAVIDPGSEPAAECERRCEQALVKSVLGDLSGQVSATNFSVFYQRGIEGRTGAEVAAALSLTQEQVRFRYHRVKRKFRDLFEGAPSPDPSEGDIGLQGKSRSDRIPAQHNRASCVQRLAGHHAWDKG